MTSAQPNNIEFDTAAIELAQSSPEEHERVVALLEFEIKQIRSAESEPGWTTWALLGGLATTLWLMAAEIEQHRASPQALSLIFLVLSLGLISIKVGHRFLSPSPPSLRSALRFHQVHRFLKTRTSFILDIIHSSVLLAIAVSHRHLVSSGFLITACIFFGFSLLANLSGFVMSFFRIPFTDYQTSRARQAMFVAYALSGVAVITVAGFAWPLINGKISPSVSEYRIAGLLVAICELLFLIVKRGPSTPLLQTLIDIRRNLAFGNLGLEDAKRQIEIALEGMTVADVLQDDIAGILSHIERMNVHLESAIKEVNAFTATVSRDREGIPEDQHNLLMAVRQSAETHLEHAEDIQKDILISLKKFKRRASFMLGMSPEAKDSLETVRQWIVGAGRSVDAKKAQLRQQLRDLG